MKTNKKKVTLVFIDNDPKFLKSTWEVTKDHFNTLCLNSATGILKILEQISKIQPDYIIIDVNLNTPGMSANLIERIAINSNIQENYKIWFISQVVADYDDFLADCQEFNVKVQEEIIQKPVTADYLKSILLSEITYDSIGWEDRIPLPIRIINKDLKVVYTNSLWERLPYTPDVTHYKKSFKTKHKEIEPETHLGAIFKSKSAGFSINSFWIEQNSEYFLGQIIENHPQSQLPRDVEGAIKAVFNTMEKISYSRGRFYRIRRLAKNHDKNEYSLTLIDLTKGHHKSVKSGYRLQLRGELKKRLNEYKIQTNDDISYKIRNKKDDEIANDIDINKLNNYLKVDDIDEWIEIPILTIDKRPVGLFIFDRSKKAIDAHIRNKNDEVENENIHPINIVHPITKSLLSIIRSVFEQQHYKNLETYENHMRKLDKNLLNSSETKRRYHYILDTITKCTGAKEGAMIIHHRQSPYLSVDATIGNLPKCVEECKLPHDAEKHPIVSVWRTETIAIFQDFQKSKEKADLIDYLNASNPDHWNNLSDEERNEYKNWMDKIKAMLILPVIIQGKIIGSIAIYFSNNNDVLNITKGRLQRAKSVVTRALWVIQNTLIDEQEENWQMALGHEMKSDLFATQNFMYELQSNTPDITKNRNWKQSMLYIQNAVDMAVNWVDMLRVDKGDKNNSQKNFTPHNAIEDYLELNTYKLDADDISLDITPSHWDTTPWKQLLRGEEQHFSRVIRILLNNAFKHGFAYSQANRCITTNIKLKVNSNAKSWMLSIKNPGYMSLEEYFVRFEPRALPLDRRVDGGHVGLSVARMITRSYLGNLSLENIEDNQVEVLLEWPLYNHLIDAIETQ